MVDLEYNVIVVLDIYILKILDVMSSFLIELILSLIMHGSSVT